ncbi:MAG TPA: mechanosensitive ion channel domain-containing protein [Stellaceae bacterium]|nr:mechanosensitive ion channel domain-containing protein [Stellaceae bacterium]
MFRLLGRVSSIFLLLSFIAGLVGTIEAEPEDPAKERPYLLSLPDLSSPRATLQTLLTEGETVEKSIIEHGVPWLPHADTLRMIDTVNVEQFAESRRELQGMFAAARLKDVLDHIRLPPMAEIPDAAAVKAQNITEWRVPGTAIVIAKVASGPRAGAFLFSPETVAKSAELYEAAGETEYQPEHGVNLYAEFRYLPGPMIPRAAVAALPDFMHFPIFGQALWQWIGLALLLVANMFCMLRLIAWGCRHDATATRVLRRWGQPAAALAIVVLVVYAQLVIESGLGIWGPALETMNFAFEFIGMSATAWLGIALIMRLSEAIVAALALRETSVDAQLVRVISMLLAILVGLATFIWAADFCGVPIGPLLGGLGIGGIAVALSVRPTLENIIGGLTLFADRPARVGETCQIGNQSGTIEEIGLRTTKVRRKDDTLVTIANAEMAQARIENQSRRRKTAYELVLRLRYDTSMEQFQDVAARIRDVLENHEKIIPGSERVRLSGLGEYGLELEVKADIDEVSGGAAIAEELNLSILAALRQASVNLAYPSRTYYLVRGERLQDVRPPVQELTREEARYIE